MKAFFSLFIFCTFIQLSANGQIKKVELQDNGLLFSDSAIAFMKQAVDSMNREFNKQPVATYYASKQAVGHSIEMYGTDLSSALQDIKAGLSYSEIKKKYPEALYDTNLLISYYKDLKYTGDTQTVYYTLPLSNSKNSGDYKLTVEKDTPSHYSWRKSNWIVYFRPRCSFLPTDILDAFYLTEEFTSPKLPEQYARMVDYSKYFIDPDLQVIRNGELIKITDDSTIIPPAIDQLFNYVRGIAKKPEQRDYDNFMNYINALNNWGDEINEASDSLADHSSEFKLMMKKAIDEAIKNQVGYKYLERYVGRFCDAETKLELFRNRWPTELDLLTVKLRLIRIACMAAELKKVKLWLKAQYYISGFDLQKYVVTDSTINRSRYSVSLEETGVNMPQLLIGSALLVENSISRSHVKSKLIRTGRFLATSVYKDEIEKTLIEMITDDQLGDLSRVRMYLVFKHYTSYLQDSKRQDINKRKLSGAADKLAAHIKRRISNENYLFQQELGEQYWLLKKDFILNQPIVSLHFDKYDKYWSANLLSKSGLENAFIRVEQLYKIEPDVQRVVDISDSLFERVNQVKFVIDSLKQNKNYRLYITWNDNNTFNEEDRELFLEYLPEYHDSLQNYSLSNIIHFELKTKSKRGDYFDFLLFPNGQLMLWKYCCESESFLKYSKEKLEFPSNYYNIFVYKFFDYDGKLKYH